MSRLTTPPILPAMKKPRDVIQPRWGVYFPKRKA